MSPRSVKRGDMAYIKVEARLEQLSPEEMRAVQELGPSRLRGIISAWGIRQGGPESMSIYQLCVSCYMQGVRDVAAAQEVKTSPPTSGSSTTPADGGTK